MFRNQYDTDVTVWSPQGRLHQVEYAIEAVNQGTVCLGLRNERYVVLAGLKRSPNELAAYQKKLHKIDDHMGVAMSGLTADGRSLIKHMRTEALNDKYVYGTPVQGGRLVLELADMHQKCTQSYVRRPYGVGLLVGVCDQTGPHLYVTEPSGNYYEYVAMAIGSRSQTSRTYLEKEYENFNQSSKDDLIKHALKALSSSLAGDVELDSKNASISVIGENHNFELIEGNINTYDALMMMMMVMM
jgi:20S proteasome subunit alpha 6